MEYSSRHLQTLFAISSETVRVWANEFARHLSVNATPGGGRHRLFNEDDLRVFALVAEMKHQNKTFTDIHASLDAGQRGDAPVFPADQVELMLASEQGRQLAAQVEKLQNTIVQLQIERDSLLPLKDENIRLHAQIESKDERITELNEQLREAQKRVEELAKQSGESYYKGMMDALERRGDLPKRDDRP